MRGLLAGAPAAFSFYSPFIIYFIMHVKLSETDSFEVAMRRFKRSVERAGLIPELRMRTAYEKPTTRRKRKKLVAKRRILRQLKLQSIPKRRY